jgi:hypothetical protein
VERPPRPRLAAADPESPFAAGDARQVLLEQYLAHLLAEAAAVRAELGCAAGHVPGWVRSAAEQLRRAQAPSTRAARMIAALTAARRAR